LAVITVEEAAKRLGISYRRAHQLIQDGRVVDEEGNVIQQGRLPATKFGRDYMIEESDLERPEVKDRPTGYPKGKPRNS
jgi:molybdenum-dependent DNA-binding transcriptional regulator ModE